MEICNAILYSTRSEVRDAVRQELKACGIAPSNIHNVQSREEYDSARLQVDTAYLVLDWESGPEDIFRVLSENQKKFKVETDPVFLISAIIDQRIMQMAQEFGVSHVHAGQISRAMIQGEIKKMFQETANLAPIKQVFAKVEECYRENDLSGAATILEQLNEKMPGNQRIIADLAENYIQRNEWEKAEKLIESMSPVQSADSRIKHLLARCYIKKKMMPQAISALEGAQLGNPFNLERLLELGNLFLETNPKKAKQSFQAALELAPSSKKGKMGKSSAMLLLGEVNEALVFMKEAVNSREVASIFNTSAILAIKVEKHEVGIDLYKAAVNVLGGNRKVLARLMYNMGIGYVKWSKNDLGLECFLKSSELDSRFEDAQFNVGILRAAGNKKTPSEAKNNDDLSGLEERLKNPGEQIKETKLAFRNDFDEDFE